VRAHSLLLLLSASAIGCVLDIPAGLWKDSARGDGPALDRPASDAPADRPVDAPKAGDRVLVEKSLIDTRPADRSPYDQTPADRTQTIDSRPIDKKLVDKPIVDKPIVDKAPVPPDTKPGPDGCPPVCNGGCTSKGCQISSCTAGCTCPAGWACTVTCTGSCGAIDCSKATSCDIVCGAYPGCTGNITCGTGMCNVLCGKGPCFDIDCHASCGCEVMCGSVGCQGTVTCPSKCSSCIGPNSPCTCP
jgi:hypothetical protein